jgi:hypothetical protein
LATSGDHDLAVDRQPTTTLLETVPQVCQSAFAAAADPDRPDSFPQNALIRRGACGVSRFEMYGDL